MIRRKEITYELKLLRERLQSVIAELEKLKKLVPDGAKLRAAKHGKGFQYFMRKHGAEINGEYIRKGNIETAVILAQIEYDELLERYLREAIDALAMCENVITDDPYYTVMERMPAGKKDLVRLPVISDEAYISIWKNQYYEGLGFGEGSPEYYTRNGLRVRSKSEIIIADILDEMAIPFLYEKPLLIGTGAVHPDFTLLNIRDRREIYWEHFGMMDDMDYRNNAFSKVRRYEANGIYQHDSLLVTFETGRYPLNVKDIRKMLKMIKNRLGYT